MLYVAYYISDSGTNQMTFRYPKSVISGKSIIEIKKNIISDNIPKSAHLVKKEFVETIVLCDNQHFCANMLNITILFYEIDWKRIMGLALSQPMTSLRTISGLFAFQTFLRS